MNEDERRETKRQLDALAHELARSQDDISDLRERLRDADQEVRDARERATEDGLRIGALEDRADADHETILELKGDGLVTRERAENLEVALESSRLIGAAVGIIMAFHGVTERDAFQILRKASQDGNRKLRALAEEVVLTGDVRELTLLQPPPPPECGTSGRRR